MNIEPNSKTSTTRNGITTVEEVSSVPTLGTTSTTTTTKTRIFKGDELIDEQVTVKESWPSRVQEQEQRRADRLAKRVEMLADAEGRRDRRREDRRKHRASRQQDRLYYSDTTSVVLQEDSENSVTTSTLDTTQNSNYTY